MRIDQKHVVRELIAQIFEYRSAQIAQPLGLGTRHRKTYTEDEIGYLRALIEAGGGIETVAMRLDRSVEGVGWKALDLRILPPAKQHWA